MPGLEAFLATLESAAPEVKREMDQGRAEVRIMTAHAAKGLEAPVVFLVDNGARPFSEQHLPRLLPFDATGKFWQGKGYLWRAAADIANGNSRTAAARIKEAAEEEYRRLLYVGMTRAEDRLIVCGYYGKIQPTAGTWHALVSAALAGAPETEALPDPILEGTRHRYRVVKQPARPERRRHRDASRCRRQKQAPAWLHPAGAARTGAAAAADAVAALPPRSKAASNRRQSPRSPVLDAGEEPSLAIARGLAVHRLLQVLPGLAEGERDAAARRYIERVGGAWLPDERDGAVRSVMRLLADAALRADLLAGIACRSGHCRNARDRRHRAVDLGQDRPPRSDGERGADRRLQDQPPGAVAAQTRCRRPMSRSSRSTARCCSRSIPGGQSRAALLFTEAPLLIAVPAAAMDDALVRLTRA